MTDPTERALLRTIIANPADDTARLVYADWLDEHAEPPQTCSQCGGQGKTWAIVTERPTMRPGEIDYYSLTCQHCRGTGTVSDGRAERAELIRVQCELARDVGAIAAWQAGRYRDAPDLFAAHGESRQRLWARERALLTDDRRREWARVPWKGGDAFDANSFGVTGGHGDITARATPHFRRGFVSRVEVPALEWVFERVAAMCDFCDGTGRERFADAAGDMDDRECPECHGIRTDSTRTEWCVTEWAKAVGAAHPVTEFGIGDALEREGDLWWVNETVADAIGSSGGSYLRHEDAESAYSRRAADVVRAAVLEAWAKEVRT